MQAVNTSTYPRKLADEVYDRILIGLFIFLALRLTAFLFKPIEDGGTKLILVSLIEVAMIIIMDLRFGRSNISKDVNEFNFYGLLTHLLYLPLFYANVSPIYHNGLINIMLCLVAIRLLYFGPRTQNGDFAGLPTFGLLGHVQSLLAKSNNHAINKLTASMPALLFFGAMVPLGIIIARTSDLVIAINVIGMIFFIFAMAMQFQKMLNAQHRKNIVGAQQASTAAPAMPRAQQNGAAVDATDNTSIRDLSGLVIEAYQRVHPSVQPLVAATNIHLARAFAAPPAGLTVDMKAQRIAALQNLSDIMMIAQEQLKHKEISDPHFALQIDFAFQQIFSDELKVKTVEDYATFANAAAREAGDTQLFLACDALILAWLCVIFHSDNEYMASAENLKRITLDLLQIHQPHTLREED